MYTLTNGISTVKFIELNNRIDIFINDSQIQIDNKTNNKQVARLLYMRLLEFGYRKAENNQ